MSDRATVAAVIVTYRSADLAMACAASLRADGVDDIVIVDSGSGDDSEQRVRQVDPSATFIGLARNVGYGAAANVGAARTRAPIVIVANPDLVVAPGTVPALVRALAADDRLALVGPRIDRGDGTRYPSARTFPSLGDAVGHGFAGLLTTENRWSRRYLRAGAEAAGPVDWVSGAFFAVRLMKSLLFGVSPFDPVSAAGAALLLVVTAGLAAWLPARRAAAIEPMQALRSE